MSFTGKSYSQIQTGETNITKVSITSAIKFYIILLMVDEQLFVVSNKDQSKTKHTPTTSLTYIFVTK